MRKPMPPTGVLSILESMFCNKVVAFSAIESVACFLNKDIPLHFWFNDRELKEDYTNFVSADYLINCMEYVPEENCIDVFVQI